jgi:hypothetical protein
MTIVFAICAGSMGPAHDAQATLVSVVEYYHAEFGHFFLTTSPDEITKLDTGVYKGWTRGQFEFKVDDAPRPGLVPVCRFFSDRFGPKSSHFYTAFPEECASVTANPMWTFESDAFYVHLPDAVGSCPTGTMPIYRGYNNGSGGAPAHRFTPYRGDQCAYFYSPAGSNCTREGLGPDGVAFCAPVFLELAQQRTQEFSGTWEFKYTIRGVPTVSQLGFGPAVAQYPPGLPPRYFPELPYISYGTGVAGWDPIAGKMAVAITGIGFHFDFDGVNATGGCAFVIDDPWEEVRGPCHPVTIRRI